jgi:hypothetical protein
MIPSQSANRGSFHEDAIDHFVVPSDFGDWAFPGRDATSGRCRSAAGAERFNG